VRIVAVNVRPSVASCQASVTDRGAPAIDVGVTRFTDRRRIGFVSEEYTVRSKAAWRMASDLSISALVTQALAEFFER
jgi:hypothetical protein